MKILTNCINLNKATKKQVEDIEDIKNIYRYVLKKIRYINHDDPNIIKFIISIPTIEILSNRELRHIIDSKWTSLLRTFKKYFIRDNLSEYNKLNKYKKDIIKSFIYDHPNNFCDQLVNRIKINNPFDGYMSIIKILWDNDFIITLKHAKNIIKKIKSSNP